jgi:hypothetical protein
MAFRDARLPATPARWLFGGDALRAPGCRRRCALPGTLAG